MQLLPIQHCYGSNAERISSNKNDFYAVANTSLLIELPLHNVRTKVSVLIRKGINYEVHTRPYRRT